MICTYCQSIKNQIIRIRTITPAIVNITFVCLHCGATHVMSHSVDEAGNVTYIEQVDSEQKNRKGLRYA